MKNKLMVILLLLFVFSSNAQILDTTPITKCSKKVVLKQLVAPALLITGGALLFNTTANKNLQTNIRQLFGTDFRTSADDFIQFVPMAQIYAGTYLGYKPKNDFLHQTINIAVANGIMGGVITLMKHSFKEERPDGSNNLSFPSGHTATAFTNASLLFYEYKDSNIWYASSGFLFATATGILRIANNKHYTSDVLMGAGIGMTVGLAVSCWHPFKSFSLGKSKKTTALLFPQIGNQIGVGLVVKSR